tara:strand:+ start:350 stop:691 length:342 start_codon:yes stop_codon:yes gene_type:complete
MSSVRWHAQTTGAISDRFKEPLGRYVVAAGASNASVSLAQINGWNPNVFSITAVGADIRWNIDAAASATTYYIKNGDTLYIKTPSTSDAHTLQAMRNASTDGTLEVIVWNENS